MLIDPENPPSRDQSEPRHATLQTKRKPPRSQRLAQPRPTWCGTCHPHTRRREDPDTGADRGPCPDCHPTGRTTSA